MAAKGKAAKTSVFLVWGSDEYEVSRKARELVDQYCPPAEQAFGLETVDGKGDTIEAAVKAINQCLTSLRTVGFFGASKTLWLRDTGFLAPAREAGEETEETGEAASGGGEDVKERLALLTDEIKRGLPDGQTFIISALRINKSWGLYKAIKEHGEIFEFNPPEKAHEAVAATREYVTEAFQAAGLTLKSGVLETFLERTGADSRQILNEIEKLSLYVGSRREVRPEDVKAIVSPSREAAAWDLPDAFGKRDLGEALATLRHLLSQKEAPQLLIAVLEGRVRDLLVIRQAIDRRWLRCQRNGQRIFTEWQSTPEGDALLGSLPKDPRQMHWFRLGLLVEQASRYSFDELLRAHRLLTEAHERMQSAPVPPAIALEYVLIATMRGGARAAG